MLGDPEPFVPDCLDSTSQLDCFFGAASVQNGHCNGSQNKTCIFPGDKDEVASGCFCQPLDRQRRLASCGLKVNPVAELNGLRLRAV